MNGIEETIIGIMWGIAKEPATMIVIWAILLVLEYCWSGLRNFITIILFPGRLVHIATHILFARWRGYRTKLIAMLGTARERTMIGVILKEKSPFWAYLYAISPIATAIPLYLLFLWLAIVFANVEILSLMFLWLAISMFLEGMPSSEDIATTIKIAIHNEPLAIIFLTLTPAIYALNTYAYGSNVGIVLSLVYVFVIILLANIVIKKREKIFGT